MEKGLKGRRGCMGREDRRQDELEDGWAEGQEQWGGSAVHVTLLSLLLLN